MANRMSQGEHARLQPRMEKELPKHEEFTPAKQARRRSRADKPFYPRSIYFNRQASKDGIRHFVDGMGDLNPLFRDEEYAKKTKYKSIIAPGCYLYTLQWTAPGMGGEGIHGWYSGGEWEWYRPIFAVTNLLLFVAFESWRKSMARWEGGEPGLTGASLCT